MCERARVREGLALQTSPCSILAGKLCNLSPNFLISCSQRQARLLAHLRCIPSTVRVRRRACLLRIRRKGVGAAVPDGRERQQADDVEQQGKVDLIVLLLQCSTTATPIGEHTHPSDDGSSMCAGLGQM